MHQAVFEAYQQYAPEQRVFILSRSAFPGSQRYGAALWSGDVDMTFASLGKQLAVGLNVGLAGFPLWGTDIGGFGFAGTCTPELYVRWFQFGAFCPVCRPHGDQNELREPWQFGPEVEAICRKYLTLRYRLLPYIYTAVSEACTTGIPLMRPLVLEYPTDPRVLNLSDEYLFGRDILVAPILAEGATERAVYLPAGGWVDFWADTVHVGPCSLTVSAPLDTLPLFIRQGVILPLGPEMQYSWERPFDPLTLAIYQGAGLSHDTEHTVTLYEDDGETTRYQTGAWVRTPFRLQAAAEGLMFRIGEAQGRYAGYHPERTYLLDIHQQPSVREVTCNSTALLSLDARHSLRQASSGWWWDAAKGVLAIKLRPSAQAMTVLVRGD
jgi:alpha-glucosidase